MSKIISKELLSEVLNITNVGDYQKATRNLFIYANEGERHTINIHALAYKCKEWATKKQRYVFEVSIEPDYCYLTIYKVSKDSKGIETINKKDGRQYDGEDEDKLYIEACQWILDNEQV